MSAEKIKVSAPRKNPHICYISKEYAEKISSIKEETGMSLYKLICAVSGKSLDSSENIKKFREDLKKEGFKSIGEWAEKLIDLLYEKRGFLYGIDLPSIKLRRKQD